MPPRADDDRTAEFVEAVRTALKASTVLLALDFDGTLAPLVADPMMSRPVPGTIEVLQQLTARGARLAVVTGRDAPTVLELGGLAAVPGIRVVGLYGMQSWHDGRLDTPDEPASITALRAELPGVVAGTGADGAWVEDKGLSLVVHTRTSADPGAALEAVRVPVTALAERLGLEVHDGKFVLELRPPGFDKGTALRQLMDEFGPDLVVYAGDDAGDVPALRLAARHGWAVVAAAPDTPDGVRAAADLVVDGPAAVLALLRALV